VEASTARQCRATNKRGEPCAAPALPGSSYCFHHDPTRAAERAAARRKGGKARHGRKIAQSDVAVDLSLVDVSDVMALLERGVRDLMGLENSIGRARALSSLASVALKALETGAIEERLAALEAELGTQN